MCHSASRSPCGTLTVARDHLASEHAFLTYITHTYVRTSLSFTMSASKRRFVHPLVLPILFLKKPFHTYTARIQLLRVSVSASMNTSSSASHDHLVIVSYAWPLGATLTAFGMTVLCIGESRCRLLNLSPCHAYVCINCMADNVLHPKGMHRYSSYFDRCRTRPSPPVSTRFRKHLVSLSRCAEATYVAGWAGYRRHWRLLQYLPVGNAPLVRRFRHTVLPSQIPIGHPRAFGALPPLFPGHQGVIDVVPEGYSRVGTS